MGLKVRYYFQCCLILGIIWQVLGKISCPLSDESEVMGEPSYFYPFGNSTNDTFALRNDDGSTGMIPISVLFPYFDENHGELTVNTNGALSFLIDVPTFTPDAFPLPDSQRIIAVFWADVDNTLNLEGFISYRETTEAEILDRASCDVRRHFVQFMNFQATWAFIATWHRVTFFGGNEFTPENSFQAVLVTDGLRSFAIFNYGNITWTTGTASGGNNEGLGGTEAQAGFNAGDGIRYAVIPGSRTPEIVNIDTLPGNLDVGRWIFRIDDENVNVGMCGMGGNIMIGPRTGLIYGGTEIFIAGPCFDNTTDIICKFNGIIVPGEIVGLQLARCISPFMTEADQAVTLELSLDDGQNFSTAYYIVESDPEYEVRRLGGDIWMEDPFFPLVIEWNPSTLDGSEYVRVDLISLGSFDPLSTAVPLLNSTLNSGTATLPFGLPDAWDPSSYIYYGIIRVSPAEQNGTQESLWSEPHDTDWYNQALVQEINTRFVTGQYLSPEALEIYAEIVQAMEMDNPSDNTGRKKRALPVIAAFLVRAFVRRIVIRAAAEVHCRAWDVVERFNPPDWSDVIPPPCTVRQARKNPLFEQDKACHSDSIFGRLGCFFFHRGASVCFRSRTPAPNGARQQSCYDAAGNLITDASIGGGTLDRASGLVGHFVHDVIPFLTCCKLTNNCQKYYDNRPTSNCDGYDGPDCAWTGGDPHIMTPDSFSYTFNGHGEYRLVNHTNFKFQGRFTPFPGLSVDATVITAVVIGKGDNRVQVEVGNTQALEVRLNGERQMLDDFGNESVPIVEGVTLQRNNDRKVTVTFTGPSACSGETITVTEMEKTLNVVTVLPSCYSGNISGLLGNFDGDPSNDLMTPSGEIIDPASNLSHIHFAFGELWRVSEEESMFTYPPGQVHTDFQDESFIPAFPAINPDAQGICMNNTFCQFDLVVTGNDNFALGTLETNEQIVREITDLERGFDACSGQPCENGGQCTVNSNDTYTCICMDGFAGENCTIVTNLCQCVNGGTCMDDGSCACLPGFTGRKCDQVFESCNDMTSPCNNAGFCQSAGDCVCPTGFRGERCDIAFMPCNGSCMNNGTCRLDGTCICTMNYTGQMCETKIQPCNSSLCMNGGVCLPSGRCSCPDTHVGAQCEATRACVSSPCYNNGSCFDIDATFYCSCSSGFTGATCDTESDQMMTESPETQGPDTGPPDEETTMDPGQMMTDSSGPQDPDTGPPGQDTTMDPGDMNEPPANLEVLAAFENIFCIITIEIDFDDAVAIQDQITETLCDAIDAIVRDISVFIEVCDLGSLTPGSAIANLTLSGNASVTVTPDVVNAAVTPQALTTLAPNLTISNVTLVPSRTNCSDDETMNCTNKLADSCQPTISSFQCLCTEGNSLSPGDGYCGMTSVTPGPTPGPTLGPTPGPTSGPTSGPDDGGDDDDDDDADGSSTYIIVYSTVVVIVIFGVMTIIIICVVRTQMHPPSMDPSFYGPSFYRPRLGTPPFGQPVFGGRQWAWHLQRPNYAPPVYSQAQPLPFKSQFTKAIPNNYYYI